MDMNALRRQLDTFNTDLEDVNKLLLETEDASEGLVRKMKELSGIGSKGGIIRSIITRFSVAVPSLYKLTQQASSLLLIFRYIDTARTESLKEEAKVVESLKRREDIQRRLFKLNKAMSKNNLSALEKEQYYNDASIKNLMKSMSFNDALLQTQQKLSRIKDKIAKSDDKIFAAARGRYVSENYGGNLIGGSLTDKAAIMMGDEEVAGLTKRRIGMTGERNQVRRERSLALTRLKNAKNEKEKRIARQELDVLEKTLNVQNDTLISIKEELAIAREKRDELLKNSKEKGFEVSGSASYRTFKDLTPYQKFMKRAEMYKLAVLTKFDKIKEGLKKFFSKGNMARMGQNAMKFAKFLGYALGFILVLGILVFALRKMGVIEAFADVFSKLKEMFAFGPMIMWTNFVKTLKGIWGVLSGMIGFIIALFTGDNAKLKENFLKIMDSLGNIIEGIVMMAVGALVTLVVTFVIGIFGILMGTLMTGINYLKDVAENVKGGTTNVARGLVTGAGLGMIAGGIIGTVVGPGGTIAGAVAGAKIGAAIGGTAGLAGRMASGGTNLMGGNYLVGENGPEIVSIPGGSSVVNNTNTRSAMGNTIHVHVNGRVGASEQELNQLADKIGQKISMRMNRFSPTGMRG